MTVKCAPKIARKPCGLYAVLLRYKGGPHRTIFLAEELKEKFVHTVLFRGNTEVKMIPNIKDPGRKRELS